MKNNNRTTMNPVRTTNLTVDKTILDNIFNKTGKTILEQNEFEYLKQIATKNKIGLISFFNSETGFRIKKINVIENNEIFKELLNGINLFKIVNPSIEVEYIFDALVISKKNITEVIFHNVIKISLRSGSYIKISSTTSDSLEIPAIRVNENKIRNGEGSRLMNIVFDFCYSQLEFRPRFVLECTGNLKSHGVLAPIGIQGQTSFFRKFGFRVENRKHYPEYVMMSSPKILTDKEELFFQLAA